MYEYNTYFVTKRITDIVVSAILLFLISPLILLLMVFLKCTAEHQIFFLQERIGYKNRKFKIWKFITMYANSSQKGTGDITIKNDPRLLPTGKWLRQMKLDEIPQLINLLRGDMSIVGPRPLMVNGFKRYSPDVQNFIYNVKPGITGIGSLVFRDEASILNNCEDYEATYQEIIDSKGDLELWYQQNRSILTDAKIVFLTVWAILYPKSRLVYRVFRNLPVPEIVSVGLTEESIPVPLLFATEQVA